MSDGVIAFTCLIQIHTKKNLFFWKYFFAFWNSFFVKFIKILYLELKFHKQT